MQHPFDTAIALTPITEHVFNGATTGPYANMIGPFGGATSAAILNAALQHPQAQGSPISLTVNFAGPLADGEFEIKAIPIRTNRSTQHWSFELQQDGQIAATATAVFALRRETWSAPEAMPPSDMPPAQSLTRAPTAGMPAWTQSYDMRFAPSELPSPFDGQMQAHANSRFWVRDEPTRPLDFASLASLCDCFFPRIFLRRRSFTPIGTVSLTCFFHADAALLAEQSDRHVLACARALNYRNGYFDQSAEIWSDSGQLLASSHQMVYYRE